MSKKILVTGADSFIGSHLTEELVGRGYDVRAFVLNSWGWLDSSLDEIKGSLDVFAGDIRDPHGVITAMEGCDAVLPLAALIGIPYSYYSPDTYIDTNVKGTLNINSKTQRLSDWRPLYGGNAGLRRGLEETIAWFMEPDNLKNYKLQYAI